jgi:hypothetical protein
MVEVKFLNIYEDNNEFRIIVIINDMYQIGITRNKYDKQYIIEVPFHPNSFMGFLDRNNIDYAECLKQIWHFVKEECPQTRLLFLTGAFESGGIQ